jgi:hypothetical protein
VFCILNNEVGVRVVPGKIPTENMARQLVIRIFVNPPIHAISPELEEGFIVFFELVQDRL